MATEVSPRSNDLVQEGTGRLETIGYGLQAIALALLVASMALLFELVEASSFLGVATVHTWMGLGFTALGLGFAAVAGLSWTGFVESTPVKTAGVGAALVYGLLGFVLGGLVASQTLGLQFLWVLPAVVAGALVFLGAIYPREDLGSTLPPAGFLLITGLVYLTGVIGVNWRWQPIPNGAVFDASIALIVTGFFAGLLGAWTAARAGNGFGSRGRQSGAYLLVSINAVGMAALLFALVTFVTVRGWAPMTRGIKTGIFWEPIYWFHFQPIGEYVIFQIPGLWFYWPFTMQGAELTNEINGVAPAIIGTFWLVFGAVLFAVPLGVGAAVFLTEYAEQGRFTRLVEISTNGLWSTPSIVYGLFGLALLVPRLGNSNSLLTGMLVLGFMLLPLVVITSRESLKSVPDEYRDASAALGVSQWQTIKSVVLPAAMPGVITGVILGVGRIAGETAPILLVTGGAPFPKNGANIFDPQFAFTGQFPFVSLHIANTAELLQPSSALPYQLYAVITAGLSENLTFAWGTALVLLLVVLSFYAIGIASRAYFRRKLQA